jgi:hypothetical protein
MGIGLRLWVVLATALAAVLGCGIPISTAAAVEPYEYLSSFGPDGTESSALGQAGAIAVDQTADTVYVMDHAAGSLYRFDTEGEPVAFTGAAGYIAGNEITGLSLFSRNGEAQVAADSSSHNFYVTSGNAVRAFQEDGEPYEFTAGPGAGTSEIGGFSELLGVAVDVNGDIYAADFGGFVKVFAPTGEQITEFSASSAANVAVDTTGAVYVNRWHGTVTKFTPSEFPVTAGTTYTEALQPIDSFAAYSVAVNPATNDVYIAENDGLTVRIAVYSETGAPLTAFGDAGEAGDLGSSEGIGVDGTSGRAFAANVPAEGLSQVEIFAPEVPYEGAPLIESVSVAAVSADAAQLRAAINPGSAATTYHFEYGLEDCAVRACINVPLGGVGIGAGHAFVAVSQNLAQLFPGSAYHFRVVAENAFGVTKGVDHLFSTQSGALGFRLGDSRVWEMVSPADKAGGNLIGSSEGLVEAAADGGGIAYISTGSIELTPEGSRAAEPATILARRTPEGWRSKDITSPNHRVVPLAFANLTEYNLFSPDLSRALLEPRDGTQLSPQSSERTPYLRENLEPPVYTPLVTGKEGFANIPPGVEFGGSDNFNSRKVRLAGATPDLSHVVIASSAPLVSGVPAGQQSLYEWSAGQLARVSVLPVGEGGEVAADLIGSGPGSVQHAISDDGSRIFWGPGNYGNAGANLTALYMRDMTTAETVRLDVVKGGTGNGPVRPVFQSASADGSVVFFTDLQQLTAGASPEGRDLYRCEISAVSPSLGCSSLVDLSLPQGGPGESAKVQGLISGSGDDGSRVYFVAEGVLDKGANPAGDSALAGEPNLYFWEAGGSTRFIATLSEQDSPAWGKTFDESPGLANGLNSASSPSGRYLSFMSNRSLTGYDSRDENSGVPVEEVFRYDAVADELSCVSCNPSGAVPNGEIWPLGERPLIDPRAVWRSGTPVAAVLPQTALIETAGVSLYRPRGVLDNGRIFFNSIDSLVSADSNGSWDVYQYEPLGLGSCTPSSAEAATVRTAAGCVSLISSGTGEGEAGFFDASVNGDDVFFLTPAPLAATDEDTAPDVYDARVNGISAALPQQTECAAACQPVAGPPTDPTPASESFNGPENAVQCPKGKRKVHRGGRVRCVASKRHKHKKHHRRRAGKTGRAQR